MRMLACRGAKLGEVVAPALLDTARIAQIALIEGIENSALPP